MDAKEYLFYGFGQIVYSVALSDGKVQMEENKLLHDKVNEGLKSRNVEYDYSGIIFDILDGEKVFTPEDTYQEGIKSMKLGSHKMTPEIKTAFIAILEEIAESFPPVTLEEQSLLVRFRKDIENL